jgi:hypothetical protein
MAETQAAIGYGTTVEVASAIVPSTSYVDIGEVTSVNPPGITIDTIEASHMKSPDKFKEYITGLKDGSDMTVNTNYVPGSAGDIAVRTMLGEDKPRNVRITFPNGSIETFAAYLTNRQRTVPVDGKMTCDLTFKVTGTILSDDPS